MTGTVKVKKTSEYRYKGLTLDIIGVYQHHTDPDINDIYPVGSVTYKLSLKGTKWEGEESYTVIHDSHLEDIKTEGSVEANVWYNRLKNEGQKVINQLFNYNGDKTIDELYDCFNESKYKTINIELYDGDCIGEIEVTLEKKNKILSRILEYVSEYNATCGETIHQSDDCIIYAPDVLSDIVDDILKIKTEFDD